MKELLTQIAKALVDSPDSVEVKEVVGERSIILELKVVEADRGKVIGKQGRIIRSIRTIIGAVGAKAGKRINVEVVE